jgi:hypothetical protein
MGGMTDWRAARSAPTSEYPFMPTSFGKSLRGWTVFALWYGIVGWKMKKGLKRLPARS